MDKRRLSDEWGDLAEGGEVPERGRGATAERVEADKGRTRKRMPSEERRRKISPTLSPALLRKLKGICKAEGYVNGDDKGVIVSAVIEDLLWAAVEAYERGEFEEVEVVSVEKRLQRKGRK